LNWLKFLAKFVNVNDPQGLIFSGEESDSISKYLNLKYLLTTMKSNEDIASQRSSVEILNVP